MTPQPEVIAVLISSLSLIVAVISLLISWRVATRDRASLSLSCEYLPKSGIGLGFLASIVNSGRRPLTVRSAHLIDNNGHSYSYRDITMGSAQFPASLPVTLEESEEIRLMFPIWHMKPKNRDPRSFVRLEVIDTRGNKASISLKKIVKNIPDNEALA